MKYRKIKQCPETGSIPEYFSCKYHSLYHRHSSYVQELEMEILINVIISTETREDIEQVVAVGIAKDNSQIVH